MSTIILLLVFEAVAAAVVLSLAKKIPRHWFVGAWLSAISFASACSLGLALWALSVQINSLTGEIWPALMWMIAGLAGFAIVGRAQLSLWLVVGPCGFVAVAGIAISIYVLEPIVAAVGIAVPFIAALVVCGWRLATTGSVCPEHYARLSGVSSNV